MNDLRDGFGNDGLLDGCAWLEALLYPQYKQEESKSQQLVGLSDGNLKSDFQSSELDHQDLVPFLSEESNLPPADLGLIKGSTEGATLEQACYDQLSDYRNARGTDPVVRQDERNGSVSDLQLTQQDHYGSAFCARLDTHCDDEDSITNEAQPFSLSLSDGGLPIADPFPLPNDVNFERNLPLATGCPLMMTHPCSGCANHHEEAWAFESKERAGASSSHQPHPEARKLETYTSVCQTCSPSTGMRLTTEEAREKSHLSTTSLSQKPTGSRRGRSTIPDNSKVLVVDTGEVEDVTQDATKEKQRKRSCRRWTANEDAHLMAAIRSAGGPPHPWKEISEKFFRGERNPAQCKGRWKKTLDPNLKRTDWTPEEDSSLLTGKMQGLSWTEIAANLSGRSTYQIRARYQQTLDPNRKRSPWTQEEDVLLNQMQQRLGNQWAEISTHLPGRSESDVKNRWHNTLTSRKRKMSSLGCLQGHSISP